MAPTLTPLPLVRTYMFTDVGSGSVMSGITRFAFGTATTAAEPGSIYYPVMDLTAARSLSSGSVVMLREKAPDPIGTWLATTEGMLMESEWNPPSTYAQALDELKDSLGVTLTYVARCLGMQRSAIYRWYEGRQPHATNRSRLKTLQEFSAAWRAARLPSLRNYWDTLVPGEGTTLGQLLSSDILNINSLREAISFLTTADRMKPKRPTLGFPGRERDRARDQERLYQFIPPTSHEGDDEGGQE